ncbi:MAG: hypothetical protein JWR52_3009 [Marmoricola sp.]|nr:hypothetical protein [Marmoricola sp.]
MSGETVMRSDGYVDYLCFERVSCATPLVLLPPDALERMNLVGPFS